MNDEQWAVVLFFSDGKSPNVVDSSLRFANRKFADRAVAKLTDEIASKGLKGMTILGPVQVSGSATADLARVASSSSVGVAQAAGASASATGRGTRQFGASGFY